MVVIKTRQGLLRGYTRQSVLSGATYYAFQGIPYGKPPLGPLRFKEPEPFGCWESIRDALKEGNDAKQPFMFMFPKPGMDPNQVANGDEDCLYLNVYTNELPESSTTRKPVMFYIHPGGFTCGSGSMLGPDFLLSEQLVIVSINYRCGAFGFLSLETDDVPGNAGLKDQTLALKWVRDNIHSFGGDPNNVTIFGMSAGAASSHFHLLSPSSRGLFHKAIMQSGFAFNPWTIQESPRTVAKRLARVLGCDSDQPTDILQCLQSVPADDIIVATNKLPNDTENVKTFGFLFTPCVEVAGSQPFLANTPDNLMKKGEFTKIPVILGVTAMEGKMLALTNRPNDHEFAYVNENPDILVPPFLGLRSGSPEEKDVAKAIWDFYWKGNPLSWNNVNDYFVYQSDFQFNFGMTKISDYLVEHSSSPVFSYLFTNHSRCICELVKLMYADNEHLSKLITPDACHAADAYYISASDRPDLIKITDEDREAIKKHVKAWASFASKSDPNCKELGVKWERNSKNKPYFMEIGTSWNLREGVPFAERMDFWWRLSKKYST